MSAIMTGERRALRCEVVARLARALDVSPAALGKMLYECFPLSGEPAADPLADLSRAQLEERIRKLESNLG